MLEKHQIHEKAKSQDDCILFLFAVYGSEIFYVAYKGYEAAVFAEFRATLSILHCSQINKKICTEKNYYKFL